MLHVNQTGGALSDENSIKPRNRNCIVQLKENQATNCGTVLCTACRACQEDTKICAFTGAAGGCVCTARHRQPELGITDQHSSSLQYTKMPAASTSASFLAGYQKPTYNQSPTSSRSFSCFNLLLRSFIRSTGLEK